MKKLLGVSVLLLGLSSISGAFAAEGKVEVKTDKVSETKKVDEKKKEKKVESAKKVAAETSKIEVAKK